MAAASPTPPARTRRTDASCHEEVFVQRYEWLRRWALRLAGNLTDADDLLHDAFLQFVLRRRDLSEIDNVDAYLYGMLRRLRLSKRRASLRAREDPLGAIEFDTAELSLSAVDARDALRLEEELRHVCTYACRRKERSKSGSVLLLRFFHGFFPGEIARILNCPLRGANDWLRIARREAREYLVNPPEQAGGPRWNDDDPLNGLRAIIWASRVGECPSPPALARLYRPGTTRTIACGTLAHIVSCRACLARVTTLLGMSDPGDRDPHDMLGQDTSWRSTQLHRWQHALRTARHHAPRELRVAVNGVPVGHAPVAAVDSRFTCEIDLDEALAFVEVFSEQGVRLLLSTIAEPGGENRVELDEGRRLAVTLRHHVPRPIVEIRYRDPQYARDEGPAGEPPTRVLRFDADASVRTSLWQRLRARLGVPPTWPLLQPALCVLVLTAAVAIWTRAPWRVEPVSAAQILADARSLEVDAASAPDLAVHRVLQLDELRLPDRVVRTRRRIDGWHSAGRQLVARRMYDERGRLLTAEWIRRDGSRTVYRRGESPHVGSGAVPTSVTTANAWQWEPSIADFERLPGRGKSASVDERDDRYVLTYRSRLTPGSDGLLEATLVVSKKPLRPIAQSLVMRERGELREFRFTEIARRELPSAQVPEVAFEPDPELLGPPAAAPPEPPRVTTPRPAIDPIALDRLEVDVLFALHRLEACLDGPAGIALAPDGRIEAAVRPIDDECRRRILRTLNTRVRVTFPLGAASPPPGPASAAIDTMPAYRAIVRRFNVTSGAAERDGPAVAAARAFGAWALELSRRAHADAVHLDRLTARWPDEALMHLDVDRAAQWQDVVRDHARQFRRSAEALRLQLTGLLPSGAVEGTGDAAAASLAVREVSAVAPAVARIVSIAALQHTLVRAMFDPSLDTPRVAVDVRTLHAALLAAEAQAAWFDEPWTMADRAQRFGIASLTHHLSVKAP